MEIKNEIIAILQQVCNVEEESENLVDYGINSLKFIKLVVELEKKFEIEFDDDILNYSKVESVGQIVDYINELKIKRL